MPPRERQADAVDAEACPERSDAITLGADVATPPEWTIVATTDDVNCTPSPQTSSADRRLKRFTERVTRARQPPLLELPDSGTGHSSYPNSQVRGVPGHEVLGTLQRDAASVDAGDDVR
jgi:hypothetical protein